jgi:glycerol-3-phosphate O-acyltransferase
MPVTPVPLVAAAILSFGRTVIGHEALLEMIERYRDHLRRNGARLIRPERTPIDILDRAWRTLHMRRLVVRERGGYVVLPRHRPLLEYYANSIAHLLPHIARESIMHPDRGPDDTLPRLRPWKPA